MAKRKKIIQVPHGTVAKMCKVFGCRRTAIYDALGYKTESELAKTIRKNALAFYGGVETSKIVF